MKSNRQDDANAKTTDSPQQGHDAIERRENDGNIYKYDECEESNDNLGSFVGRGWDAVRIGRVNEAC